MVSMRSDKTLINPLHRQNLLNTEIRLRGSTFFKFNLKYFEKYSEQCVCGHHAIESLAPCTFFQIGKNNVKF